MWTVVVRDPEGRVHSKSQLTAGALTIGRGKDCSIVLSSKAVSRNHGRVELRGRQLVYVDEGSANGSTVNGQSATGAVSVDEKTVIDIAGFHITVERAASDEPKLAIPETPKPAAPPPKTDRSSWGSATDIFDQQVRGIQSQRHELHRTAQQQLAYVEEEWAKVVEQMRALQARVAGNPKVQHFVISRDAKEVTVKLTDSFEKRGYSYFVLSRHHPDGQIFPGMEHRVWLREFGGEDKQYTEPKKAMAELVSRIAGKLA